LSEQDQDTSQLDIARDPKDNIVLEAAEAGQAGFIVSGDDDLLALEKFDLKGSPS
jgi:putative PIN family toxin of toxin-antitoxin system